MLLVMVPDHKLLCGAGNLKGGRLQTRSTAAAARVAACLRTHGRRPLRRSRHHSDGAQMLTALQGPAGAPWPEPRRRRCPAVDTGAAPAAPTGARRMSRHHPVPGAGAVTVARSGPTLNPHRRRCLPAGIGAGNAALRLAGTPIWRRRRVGGAAPAGSLARSGSQARSPSRQRTPMRGSPAATLSSSRPACCHAQSRSVLLKDALA